MPWPWYYTGGYDPGKTAFYVLSRRIVAVILIVAVIALIVWWVR
ncbi:MAG: hypothetical protein V4472_24880 [Pseudomonadota bacterium]